MKPKDESVNLRGLSAEAWRAVQIADQLHDRMTSGHELVVTSARDGKHSVERSAHYRGDAVDLRIWHLDSPGDFAIELRNELGNEYVVLLEKDHVHVHWSPLRA